jgi:hypothetical protein
MRTRLTRIKNRVYETASKRDDDTGEEYEHRHVKSQAEYAVINGQKVLARLKLNNGQWVAVERGDDRKFGLVVSPLNIRGWRDLRRWALKKWGGANRRPQRPVAAAVRT